MQPEDLSPSDDSPSDESVSPRIGGDKWILTREAFDKLLGKFSSDREEAAIQHELMRIKLIRYFEWKSTPSPADQADETVNRVARRIDEGEEIFNLPGYFRKVAHLVFLESRRYPERDTVDPDDLARIPAPPPPDEQKEARLRCLESCLDKQPSDNRKLILEYYVYATRKKIDHRLELADGSSINAVRIRACRIRKKLEKCVKDCLSIS